MKTPQLVKYILGFDPQMLLDRDLTVPEELEHIILRSLAPDPQNRYESALEMLEDINDYCYESGIRLLDAHFASYVERILAPPAERKRSLLSRIRDDG